MKKFQEKEAINLEIAAKDIENGLYIQAKTKLLKLKDLKDKSELFHLLGICELKIGNIDLARNLFKKAINIKRKDRYISNLAALEALSGNLELSIYLYKEAIEINNKFNTPIINLANLFVDIKNYIEAKKYYDLALINDPNNEILHYAYAVYLQKKGDNNSAIIKYQNLIKINPRNEKLYFNIGNIYLQENNYNLAKENYKKAIEINPLVAEAYNNLGLVYLEDPLENFDESLFYFEKALSIKVKYEDPLINKAVYLIRKNQHEKAIEWLNAAIQINVNNAKAYAALGDAYLYLKNLDSAISAYQKSLNINEKSAEVNCNYGIALIKLKKYELAINFLNRSIEINGGTSECYFNLANSQVELKKYDLAIESYEKAITKNEKLSYLYGSYLFPKLAICDWQDYSFKKNKLKELINTNFPAVPPFASLFIFDELDIHNKCATKFFNDQYENIDTKNNFNYNIEINSKKINIGYYSGDFHNHATSYLMAELFELHDKNEIALFGFSFGPIKSDEMRNRLHNNFEKFLDCNNLSDDEICKISRELGIVIAIDLKGYTQNSRPGIFANRLAPIQVNYLGYPGTMGAKCIDYIIADKIVIPEKNKKFFTENIVYLPNSYQVNDSKRIISEKKFNKSELGLPDTGFIYCCFNNNYKITPSIYDSWIRILKAVEGSVLWLFEDNPLAAENLGKEAEKRGVDRKRLVFAKRMPLDEHLARHRLADLFIDTLPYNAHTTASDALWAGLPVLTLIGESFAARVAASLLNAIGLPELITTTQEEYEAKAIELASNPLLLKQIKQKLAQNRLTTPLFNTRQFAKNIEVAYKSMYERYQQNLAPEHLYIEDIGASQESSLFIDTEMPQNTINKPNIKLFDTFELDEFIQVLDIGASAINEVPFYKPLLETGLAHLNAFEGDPRQIENIRNSYKSNCTIFNEFLFDGTEQTLYVASEASGMSSLLEPNHSALNFFNGFDQFGKIERTEKIQTKRLDDITGIKGIDILKMDIQGAELTVLQNASEKLKNCLVVQLEVSYIALYKNQPSFGDIDVWMRKQGYVPHCFLDIKRWSIAPTIFDNNFRVPGNQLLESDIVYIKDPLELKKLTDAQVIKFLAITHYSLKSYDLAVYLILEIQKRNLVKSEFQNTYLKLVSK